MMESNLLQCSYRYDQVLSVFISDQDQNRRGQSNYIKVFHIYCPPCDALLFETISSILAFATAANYKNKIHTIHSTFKVPRVIVEIVDLYNQLQEFNHVIFTNISESRQALNYPSQKKICLLYSGGKDSYYKLVNVLDVYEKRDIIGVYVKGGMVNSEFPAELNKAEKLFNELKIELKTIDVWHGDYKSPPIRMALRTIWRDMLLFSIARIFSDNIATGINEDEIFEKPPLQVKNELAPDLYLLFSETKFVLDKMAECTSSEPFGHFRPIFKV